MFHNPVNTALASTSRLPCVHNGELTRCGKSASKPFDTYIDVEKLRQYWPDIITFAEFTARADDSADADRRRLQSWQRDTSKVFCLHDSYASSSCERCQQCRYGLGIFSAPKPLVQAYGWPIGDIVEVRPL